MIFSRNTVFGKRTARTKIDEERGDYTGHVNCIYIPVVVMIITNT